MCFIYLHTPADLIACLNDGHVQGEIQITSVVFSSISFDPFPPPFLLSWTDAARGTGAVASLPAPISACLASEAHLDPPDEKRTGSGCSPRFSFLLLRSRPCTDPTHVRQSNTNCDNHQAGLLQSDLPLLGSTVGNAELQLLCQLCSKYLIAETPSTGCCCTGGHVV